MNDKELAKELEIWFNKVDKNYQNLWCSNPVAKLIKTNLVKWDNFKNRPRGKSSRENRTLKEWYQNMDFK